MRAPDMTIRERVATAIDEACPGDKGLAAITAFLKAAAEPDENGVRWHMKPVEPTQEMLAIASHTPLGPGGTAPYRAMLDASPKFEWDK